ncbi:MAG: nucleotidyltransferase domain-containing protein [Planctomycetes bacterium]|nr:nucleotidyltransferase domain-containing protein [Planctomycetota bacterium]
MVSMRDIRRFAQAIAREFKPQRIILFGSYAYGRPTSDSDVDLLVIMPYRGHAIHKAVEIRGRLGSPFPLDLLVRTPREVERRLAINDWFMHDIIEKGKVLHDADDARMGRQGRGGFQHGQSRAAGPKGSKLRRGLFPRATVRREVP